ncbi:MAG TPA: hypothetical protein PLO68_19175, partial [Sedimentisphaerales bacterium]|nr:hypothetical protein [Sedimentisphaerales bacterium]
MKVQAGVVLRFLSYGIVVALAGGCMMGPKYSRPKTPAETAPSFVHAPEPAQDTSDWQQADRW